MDDTFSNIAALYARYKKAGVKTDIGPYDNMYQSGRKAHYFSVGENAVSIIAGAMIKTNIRAFSQVLDLPCGSGRVLRHLKAFLPHANLTAGDIDENHVNYCVDTFDAQSFQT